MKKSKKICEIFIDGLYFHVRSKGINYKYIEADEIMDFISHVVINAALTKSSKNVILHPCVRRKIKHQTLAKAVVTA